MNKDAIYRAICTFLSAVVILLSIKTCQVQKDADRETTELRKSIIAADRLTKEADGRYSKLVDYYSTNRDLIKELKETNRDLYKKIKENNERLLSITNSIITLDKKVVDGFAKPDPVDTNKLNISLRYPDEKNPFVFWDGWLNRHTAAYRGTFSFGKLPIQVVLTEESRGLWKSRIIGPDWLKVDSMSIKSIPPEDYIPVKARNIQWLIGGNYAYNLTGGGQGIGLTFGLNLFDRHNLFVGANTINQFNIGYLYKIKTFKKK